MPINAVCPDCGASFTLADQQAGKKVRCTHCQGTFTVPTASTGSASRVSKVVQAELVEEDDAPPRSRTGSPSKKGPAEPPRSRIMRAEVVEPVSKARPANPPSRAGKAPPSPPSSARSSAKHRAFRDAEDEDEDDRPRPKKKSGGGSNMPLILGGVGALLLVLLVGGGGLAYLLLRDKSEPSTQVASNPQPPPGVPSGSPPAPGPVVVPDANPFPTQPTPVTPTPVTPTPVTPGTTETQPDKGKLEQSREKEEDPPERPSSNGQLSESARKRVEKATVFIRVTSPDGTRASGTGFFGAEEARNIVLTNAHVVGMLAPESPRPRKVEIIINSGEPDERTLEARVLGVDRSSDLAVLDVGTTERMPEPLKVKSAKALRRLDPVYVFGFPLGEQLGKEITVRDSTVSSLRHKNGALDKIQVNGGMDPGNSGGPVTDSSGHVVGVAVSGYEGRQINFAIPGDRVHTILNGRISAFGTETPFRSDTRVGVPVTMQMIDPRNKVQEVGVDIWIGDPPRDKKKPTRPAAVNTPPAPEPGDTQHMRYPLVYRKDLAEGKADILLPELPAGKVYWHQPTWVNAVGERHWVVATVLRVRPEDAVERTPAILALRYPRGSHPLTITAHNSFRIGSDDEDDKAGLQTRVYFQEQVASSSAQGGATLTLKYQKAERQILRAGRPPRQSTLLEEIKDDLPYVQPVIEVDSVGNLTRNLLNYNPQVLFLQRRQHRKEWDPKLPEKLQAFHAPIQDCLEATAIKLPGGTVKAGDTWSAVRALPIDTPGSYENGEMEMTYTYLGQRKRNGRDEAVINLSGIARGRGKRANSIGGQATGKALVDLTTGQVTSVEVNVTVDLQIKLADSSDKDEEERTIKVIATLLVRAERPLAH